ncbi:MAG: DUF1343 domain-containing protein [Saprospiraceae bacterium]|nr:DUF1343 domain-containing protein [Saprospiraceae bacterium]
MYSYKQGIIMSVTGLLIFFAFCQHKVSDSLNRSTQSGEIFNQNILPADYNLNEYLPHLKNKRVGVVVHPCSVVKDKFLVDTLLVLGVNVQTIFAPEHGFRGIADAGELINNEVDSKTGIKIISLYGKNKKPTGEQLKDLDVILFDLQDVGARFYTYLSSLHYVMEACNENNKKLIVLDRPNPNGHFVDGPVLEDDCKSFIGIHPIPVVHGMTLGELALMIKGEGWIKNSSALDLQIIHCNNYKHSSRYILPVKPSPNLPNEISILLYPSICLLEGTCISLGRGTESPFQIYGHPSFVNYDTTFTPLSIPGAKTPPLLNQMCKGYSLRNASIDSLRKNPGLNLAHILNSYKEYKGKEDFFLKNNFIDLLIGNKFFKEQIQSGMNEFQIKESWKEKLNQFKILRKKYLLYD